MAFEQYENVTSDKINRNKFSSLRLCVCKGVALSLALQLLSAVRARSPVGEELVIGRGKYQKGCPDSSEGGIP